MPHSIPVEASDMLAFTPSCLANTPGAPVFHLRTITWREEQYYKRLLREATLVQHSESEMRETMREELERLWTSEAFSRAIEVLEAYWQAVDSFALEKKENSDAAFDFADMAEIDDLDVNLRRFSPKIARMVADNAEAADVLPLLFVAVAVARVDGLSDPLPYTGGFLSIDGAAAIMGQLKAVAGDNAGTAWAELMVASIRRMRLSGEQEKNSESPLPSDTPPASSNTATAPGKSRASERSTETISEA
jgi:tellurite resistance protein